MPLSVAGRTGALLLVAILALHSPVLARPVAAATASDPFADATWFVDPDNDAAREADHLRPEAPIRATLFDRIATRAQADWFGDWIPTDDLTEAVAARTSEIRAAGALPVHVAYAIPARDCGGYSAGGTDSPAAYRDWVDAFAVGLDGGPAAVVVEPDALAQLDCLSPTQQGDRVATALAVSRQGWQSSGTVVLARSDDPADALSASGLAARSAAAGDPWPILLAGDTLGDQTSDAIERLGAAQVVMVGGTAVLPAGLDDELVRLGVRAQRLAGATRHGTSVAVASLDLQLHGGGPLLLATSAEFADGLASGALAARASGVLMLAPPAAPDPMQVDWVRDSGAQLTGTTAVGGQLAVSHDTQAAMEQAQTSS